MRAGASDIGELKLGVEGQLNKRWTLWGNVALRARQFGLPRHVCHGWRQVQLLIHAFHPRENAGEDRRLYQRTRTPTAPWIDALTSVSPPVLNRWPTSP